ncbi:hypothetical protein NP233_g9107 [Leucocoprinus birnbaumii]|uniref:Uncharacterized protein n=1 Tax=Leucocoprinus birnbaumii TaxID=56174 RepID=A0AAD5VMS6_9AGAR|nr:hypothetical protein NP233_g9107 [Leucocoprinus birnbaumii]
MFDNSAGNYNVVNQPYNSQVPTAANTPPPLAHTATQPRIDSEKLAPDVERRPLTGFISLFYSLYTTFLLQLPNVYISRIERLGGQAELASEDILKMAARSDWSNPSSRNNSAIPRTSKAFLDYVATLESNVREANDVYKLPVSYLSLGRKWQGFVDSLLQEWQTLNLVSALLVPGILTVFQVDGASNDPITRYLAFWSLISALLSLLYGCLFIIQFSQMKKTTVGIEWMTEAFRQDNNAKMFWAVDIMLALPAIWLAWSILAFIVCIMTFLWRAGPIPPDSFNTPNSMILGFRIFISSVLGIGSVYCILIFYTFQRYGLNLDAAIARRIQLVIDGSQLAAST